MRRYIPFLWDSQYKKITLCTFHGISQHDQQIRTIKPRKVVRERRPIFCLTFFSCDTWYACMCTCAMGGEDHPHDYVCPLPWWALNQIAKVKKLLFHFWLLHWLSKMIAVPTQQSDVETEHFYSQSVPSKQTIVVMSTNGKLCINALRAEMICFHFWLLCCLPMVMTVPMSQSEMKAELFGLQSDDAKLTIVGMFWMFRNYSLTSLFSSSVLRNFNSMWQCLLDVSQLWPIYTYTICNTFLSLSLGYFPDETEQKCYLQLFCTMWGITADNFFFCLVFCRNASSFSLRVEFWYISMHRTWPLGSWWADPIPLLWTAYVVLTKVGKERNIYHDENNNQTRRFYTKKWN